MAPSFLLVLFLSVFAASSFAQTVNPNNTIAYGTGLNLALAGQVAIFYVQPVDTNGKNITNCQLPFGAVLFNNSAQPIALRNDCTAGLIAYHYQARIAAVYTLQITYQGQVISKGNYHPVVIPGPVYAPGSIVTGPGLNSHSVGLLSSMNITQWDAYGNRNYSCNIDGRWLATLSGASAQNTTFQSCSQGVWSARYLATVSGPYDLRISLNGQNAQGSPFHLILSAGALDAKLMYASGPGASNATAGVLTVFYIITKDQYGNFITSCGGMDASDFNVYFTAGNTRVNATIVSCNAGVWTINYNITTAIKWQLWLYYKNIKSDSSPTNVYVFPSSIIDGERSQASGAGLSLATAGVPAPFDIIPFDIYGNQITTCSKDTNYTVWGVTVVNGSETCTAGVAGCTNGKYNGQYSCYKSQYYSLSINYRGETIKGSPFKPFVQPGAINGPTSFAMGSGLEYAYAGVPAVFEIDAYDQYNNKIHKCPVPLNPTFQIIVQATDIGVTVNGNITACTDGNFTGQYIINRLSYLYTVSINYGGNAVDQSPYSIQTYAGPPDLNNCVASGQGLNSTIAGNTVGFNLKCQDQYGNWVATCFNSSYWDAELSGPANLTATFTNCDLSTGQAITYFTYTPYRSGIYDLDISFVLTVPTLHFNPVVYPSTFDPSRSYAIGEGVTSQNIPAGTNTTFYILSVDSYGNNVTTCLTTSDLTITITNNNGVVVYPSIKTCYNGNIPVSWMSTVADPYTVSISYRGSPIYGSPYNVRVVAGPIYPSKCTASGQGLTNATAGVPAYVSLICYDQYNNLATQCLSNSSWSLSLSGPQQVTGTVPFCSTGTYSGYYVATKAGTYSFQIRYNSVSIKNSPFSPYVTAGALSAARSIASGPGWDGQITIPAGNWTSFGIQSYDIYDNIITQCTVPVDYWRANITINNSKSTYSSSDCTNGRYLVKYSPVIAGRNRVDAYAASSGTLVKNNPGSINVVASTFSASNSYVSLLSNIAAGQKDPLKVTSKDAYGNVISTCQSSVSLNNFKATAVGSSSPVWIGTIQTCSAGVYSGFIQINQTGSFAFKLTYQGSTVPASTNIINVNPGTPSAIYSLAEGQGVDPTQPIIAGNYATFYIKIYNQYGLHFIDSRLCTPALNWQVAFTPQISVFPKNRNITFGTCSGGTVPVTYNATWANYYTITITGNGVPISGNPYHSRVIPTYLDPTKTQVSGLSNIFITFGTFQLIGRDIYGNPGVNLTDNLFTVSLSPSCNKHSLCCNFDQGVIDCSFWVWEGGRYCVLIDYKNQVLTLNTSSLLVYGGLGCGSGGCIHGFCFPNSPVSTQYSCSCAPGYSGLDCSIPPSKVAELPSAEEEEEEKLDQQVEEHVVENVKMSVGAVDARLDESVRKASTLKAVFESSFVLAVIVVGVVVGAFISRSRSSQHN